MVLSPIRTMYLYRAVFVLAMSPTLTPFAQVYLCVPQKAPAANHRQLGSLHALQGKITERYEPLCRHTSTYVLWPAKFSYKKL
jgi:hypothetical protein